MVARPADRARRLRRRLRGQREGREVASHRRAGPRGAAQPHPSWRLRMRSAHRRRGGHPGAGARRVPPPRSQGGAHRAARRGSVRRGHGVPARGGAAAQRVSEALREGGPLRGAEAARLAARSRRCRRAGSAGAQRDARDPAGVRGRRTPHEGSGRPRAVAVRHPQARRAAGADLRHAGLGTLLRAEPVEPHGGVQGAAPARSDPGLLPRPRRSAVRLFARAGPPALLHQHLPVLGPRPPLPLHRAQRRDQHAARQRELDVRAPGHVRLAAVRRRLEALPHHRPAHQRLGQLRQRARAPRADRPVAAPRGHDDDPRGVAEPRGDEPRQAGVLRVSRLPAGAVGRPGVDRLHRRPRHRRGPRSQRAAAVALRRDQGRLRRHGLGGGRPRHRARQRRAQGPLAAGSDVPGRHRAGPDRRRRRDQGIDGGAQAISPVARHQPAAPRRAPAARRRGAGVRAGDAARPPAGVRLHDRGPAPPDDADGAERPGGRRVDGDRHAARGPLRQAAAPLQLLQAALRAGDQSADRSHPRGAGDVGRDHHRSRAEPLRRDPAPLRAAASEEPHAHERRAGAGEGPRRRPAARDHLADRLPRRQRR